MDKPDILEALKPIANCFEELLIPYYIGGSIASSLYGLPRSTMDVDIVAEIRLKHIYRVKQNLEKNYYIDEEMIREAIVNESSFNLIHLKTAIKVDVFIRKGDLYQECAINRKRKDTFVEGDDSTSFYFSSPEDIILNKLLWYEMGGKVSDRQWSDIIGVVKVQSELLDRQYLGAWAAKLKVQDLLEKVIKDSGL